MTGRELTEQSPGEKQQKDSVLRWEMGTLFHCNRQWKATGVSVFDDFNFLWDVGGALIG